MSVCTFFGHGECYGLEQEVLKNAIEKLIVEGVDEFLVGHQGQFDAMVRSCLKSLKTQYSHIKYYVVLAYLPAEKRQVKDFLETIYPEGMESVPRKYAIDWRNRYMIQGADVCLCYINHTWGGAYKFVRMAKHRGLRIVNLGKGQL